jgi:hypothetical protein
MNPNPISKTSPQANKTLRRTVLALAVAGIFSGSGPVLAQTTLGAGATANVGSVAVGVNANSSVSGGVAIGDAAITAGGATAVGANATAAGLGVAVGLHAQAGGAAVAAGISARALGNNAIAVGQNAVANGANSVTMGNATYAGSQGGIAVGTSSGVVDAAIFGTAIGYNSQVFGAYGTAAGANTQAVDGAIAIGSGAAGGAQALNLSSIAIGADTIVRGTGNIGIGANIRINGVTNNVIVLGDGSTTTGDNQLSIGSAGATKKIVHVSDGVAATDAATYGQVQSVETIANNAAAVAVAADGKAVAAQSAAAAAATAAANAQGTATAAQTAAATAATAAATADTKATTALTALTGAAFDSVARGAAAAADTKATNAASVAASAQSTASAAQTAATTANNTANSALGTINNFLSVPVLNSQLQLNEGYFVLESSLTSFQQLDSSGIYNYTGGTSLNMFAGQAIEITGGLNVDGVSISTMRTDVTANGDSIAALYAAGVKPGAFRTGANSIALGDGSNDAGQANVLAIGDRRIVGMVDGVAASDGATVAQVDVVAAKFTGASFVAGAGAVALAPGGVAVGRNARAESSIAVAIGDGARAVSSVAIGAGSSALGLNTTAVGDFSQAVGDTSVSLGVNANVSAGATNSIAIGSAATVNPGVINAVALGAGTVATRSNTVEVGGKQISGVANATQANDAVNLGQLTAALAGVGAGGGDPTIPGRVSALESRVSGIQHDIKSLEKKAFAGTASAMAMAQPVYLSRKNRTAVTFSGATYQGQAATAVTVSRLLDIKCSQADRAAGSCVNVVASAGLSASSSGSGFRAGVSVGF